MTSSHRKLKRSCFKRDRLCGDCSGKRDAPRFKAPAVHMQERQEQVQDQEQEQEQEQNLSQQQAPTATASILEDTQDAVTEVIKPAKGLRGFITPAFDCMELQRTFSDLGIVEIEKWLEAEIEAEKSESVELVIPAIPSHYHNRREEFLDVCKKIAGKILFYFHP